MRLSLALIAVVALAACAGAEAMTFKEIAATAPANELGLHPGETMAFEVHLASVLVGEAQLAVGEIGIVDGREAVVVRSRASTAGAAALVRQISDESTTTLDVATRRPRSYEGRVVQGPKRIVAGATFTGDLVKVHYQRNDGPVINLTIHAKGQSLHDAHSAMAQLRGWRATPGTTRQVWVVGGRRVWRVDVRYVGEETIGTAMGNRAAVVFEGSSYRARRDLTVESDKPSRTFRVWLSDDADRVPLKVVAKTELGDIAMNLTDYTRP